MKNAPLLRRLVSKLPERLASLPYDHVERRPAPGKWSVKQELGHLVDSAANNHQRVVAALLQEQPAMPGYDGDRWVQLHAYQERPWTEVILLWKCLNLQLSAAIDAVPPEAWQRRLAVDGAKPITLAFLVDDYLSHMLHHLRHIGVPLDDLVAADSSSVAKPG